MIFVSHSHADRELVDFFARVAARTQVRLVFEELERIIGGAVTAAMIRQNIASSNAVFVLLSTNVQNLPHTRDWVLWETGVANNKDIWVFEPLEQLGRIAVITPVLRHYVVYQPQDHHFAYISSIVQSYDTSNVAGTALLGAGLGAILAKGSGALVGGALGALAGNRSSVRPVGRLVTCPQCSSSYSVHLPQGLWAFRCPVCNAALDNDENPRCRLTMRCT